MKKALLSCAAALCVIYLSAAARAQSITLLTDNFDDGVRDASKWNMEANNANVAVAEAGGTLRVTPPSGSSGSNYDGYVSTATYNLTGGQAQLEVVAALTDGTSSAEMRFGLQTGAGVYEFLKAGPNLYFVKTVGGWTDSGVAWNATNLRYWRIRHDAATDEMVWETSANGTDWTERRRVGKAAAFDISAVQVRVNAGTGGWVGSPGTAQYDNLSVSAPNRPPQVNAGLDRDGTVNVARSVSGNATDSEGSVSSVLWSKVSGPGTVTFSAVASLTTNVTASASGTYVLRLTATDDLGAAGYDELTFTVYPAATATITGGPYTAVVGEPVRVDAGSSSAHYVKIEFGDPNFPQDHYLSYPSASGRKKAEHAYLTPGTFTVTVTPYSQGGDPGTPATTTAAVSQVTTGTVRTPATADHAGVSAAINASSCGDVVQLTAGVTYSGTGIELPDKNCTGANYITIRSSMYSDPSYPGPLKRMTAADTALMAIISVQGALNKAVSTAAGADHYRFEGIRFTTANTTDSIYNLVFLFPASGPENDTTMPDHFIFNHCVITQSGTGNVKYGLRVGGRHVGFHNGTITGVNMAGDNESKAVLLSGGSGPFSFTNNYLNSSGETFFTGNDDPQVLPQGLEFRRNYLYRNVTTERQFLADGSTNPSWDGVNRIVKTTLETKNLVGGAIHGNVFVGNWHDSFRNGQPGIHLLLKASNQYGGGTSNTVEDVDVAYNKFTSAAGVLQIGKEGVNLGTKRIRVRHNLAYDIRNSYSRDNESSVNKGSFSIVTVEADDVQIDHNTSPDHELKFIRAGDTNYPQKANLSITNNIFSRGAQGTVGMEVQSVEGKTALDDWGTNWYFDGNLGFLNTGENAWVSSRYRVSTSNASLGLNQFRGGIADVKFTNPAARDYSLQPDSPAKNAGTDGTDIGADVPLLTGMTGGVVSGVWLSPAGGFNDDFNDNARNTTLWNLGVLSEEASAHDASVAVAEQNQRLEVSPLYNTPGQNYNGYVSASTYDLTGGQASVEIAQLSAPATRMIFALGTDSNNWVRFRIKDSDVWYESRASGGQIQSHGYYTFSIPSPVHRYFRLRHNASSDTVVWETSADRVNWTARHTMARPIPFTALRAELGAGSDGAITIYQPGTVFYDNFQLQGAGGAQSPYGGMPSTMPGSVEAENFDAGGLNVAYYDEDAGNNGGVYRSTDVDVRSISSASNGYVVFNARAGEWLEYSVNVTASGTYTVGASVASRLAGGTFHIEIDGVNVTGPVTAPTTGSWYTFQPAVKTGVNLTAGTHVLRLVLDTNGVEGIVADFDTITITP